jgi:hypothetical protein
VVVGLLAAITLRLGHRAAIIQYLNSPNIVAKFALVVVAFGIALYHSDLYDRSHFTSGLKMVRGLLQAFGGACLFLSIIYYWNEDISLGRGIAAIAGLTVFLLMLCSRMELNKMLRRKA